MITIRTGLTWQQNEILWSDIKEVKWLFEITLDGNLSPDFYWSESDTSYDGQDYDYKIMDFTPISLQMVEPYLDTIPENRTTITCSFQNNIVDGYTASDFKNATVLIRLIAKTDLKYIVNPDDDIVLDGAELESETINEIEIISWKYKVENSIHYQQKLTLECLDFFSFYLEGDYPNNATITELFPNKIMKSDNICVPEIYGTPYIPIRWIVKHFDSTYVDFNTFTIDGNYTSLFIANQYLLANCGIDGIKSCFVLNSSYSLGTTTVNLTAASDDLTSNLIQIDIDAYVLGSWATYDILEVRNPKEFSGKSIYLPSDYTIKKDNILGSDNNLYWIAQVLGTDGDHDNTNDSNAYWGNVGQEIYDAPFKYYKDSTVAITNPIDIIIDILEGFGIPSADIDTVSSSAIAAILNSRSLTMNVGLYYTQDRKKLISKLFTLAGVIPVIRDKIYFKLLTKVSQLSLEEDIVKPDSINISSQYTYTNKQKDSGYVNWQYGTEPQDTVNKSIISCKITSNDKSDTIIEAEWIPNEGNAKKSAKLALQRILLKDKNVSFTSFGKILILESGDIITINPENLGADSTASYDMLITKMTINKGLWIDIDGNTFSDSLDDWDDIAVIITGPEDVQTDNAFSSIYQGPDDAVGTADPTNGISNNILIGANGQLKTNVDPSSTGGFLATNSYIRCYNTSGNIRFEAVYNGVDQGDCTIGNYVGGQGCKWDQSAGIFDIAGTITADAGNIGGWDIDATRIYDVGIEMDSSVPQFKVYNGSNYITISPSGIIGYDTVLGTTLSIPTNGDIPYFSAGIIRECSYEIYTSGIIKTSTDPSIFGGLIVNHDALICYDSTGQEVFKTILSGVDEGDVIIGQYDDGVGIKWNQATSLLDVRGSFQTSIGGVKRLEISSDTNEMYFYGSNGSVIEELCSIGISIEPDSGDDVILTVGSYTASNENIGAFIQSYQNVALIIKSHDDYGILATSAGAYGVVGNSTTSVSGWAGGYFSNNYSNCYGVRCYSTNGIGGRFEGGKGQILLTPDGSAAAPTHTAPAGTIFITSACVVYINTNSGTTWQKIADQ